VSGYDWDDVRLLMHVGRRGSLLRAGAELGLAASTLSRRLTALEKKAGAVLVERGVDGCRLTERGRALADIGEQMEGRLGQEAARSASEGSISGTVTISAGDGFIGLISAATGVPPVGLRLFPVDSKPLRDVFRAGMGVRTWTDTMKTHVRTMAARNQSVTVSVRPQVLAKYDGHLIHFREIIDLARAVGLPIRTLREIISDSH
jgi:molybdenum-dependent DNA-binding transcriptional regulator ModE